MSREHRVVTVAALLALAVGACGGADKPNVESTSSPPTTRKSPAEGPSETKVESTSEEKFRAQHFQACDAMCESLTACAVAGAKANWDQLSAEERGAVEDDKVLAENTRQCASGCQEATLSPRQVTVVRGCLTPMPSDGSLPSGGQCGEFVGCLESAQKKE